MEIYKIENVKKIYDNEKVKKIMSYAMFNPTDGRIKSAAEGIYGKQQGKFYIAEENEEIVGIIGVRRVDNEYIEIMHIAVDEAFRGQGIGKKMIAFVDDAERVKKIIVESNQETVKFYRKAGFKVKKKEDLVTGSIQYSCTYNC